MTKFKLTLVTLSIILCSTLAQAQVETVFNKLRRPNQLAFKDDTMYVADDLAGEIYKIGVLATTPDTIVLAKGLDGPYGLAISGNFLFIAETGFTDGDKISKIDITSPNPVVVDVISLSFAPGYIHINGNDLFITTLIKEEVYKVDLTAQTKTAVEFVAGLSGSSALAVYNNFLYISEYKDSKISKIELSSTSKTATEVISGLNKPKGIAVKGSELYIVENGGSKIVKIDLTSAKPISIDVVTLGLTTPTDLAFHGEVIYISESISGYIKKHDPSSYPNSTKTLDTNIGITIYPNPASERVQVAGLSSSQPYTIYSSIGTKVKEGSVEPDQHISIEQLSRGLYFLQLNNGFTGKFVKK